MLSKSDPSAKEEIEVAWKSKTDMVNMHFKHLICGKMEN